MTTILTLENVSADLGGMRVLDNVSLSIQAGQIVGLIGPNGSGKSTLLNLIGGMTRPMRGRIVFDGRNISRLKPEAIFRLGIGRAFQDPALFFKMSVLDNAILPTKGQRGETPWNAPRRRLWADEEQRHSYNAQAALEEVNLLRDPHGLASDLSGGQMKLLEIARATMGAPRLLLLDEPTAGVAPRLARQIFEQIDAMRHQQGLTFLIVEHRLDILFDFADTIYVMQQGSVLMHGTPDAVAEDPQVREVYIGS
jgi:branched-chain amino acid transport system ATP-binding protein